jgi:hypothetical protein
MGEEVCFKLIKGRYFKTSEERHLENNWLLKDLDSLIDNNRAYKIIIILIIRKVSMLFIILRKLELGIWLLLRIKVMIIELFFFFCFIYLLFF